MACGRGIPSSREFDSLIYAAPGFDALLGDEDEGEHPNRTQRSDGYLIHGLRRAFASPQNK